MSAGEESEMSEPTLHKVVLTMCSACLDGEGDQCHTPGCAFIRSRCPDLSIRDSCDVESIDGAEFDYDTLKRKAAALTEPAAPPAPVAEPAPPSALEALEAQQKLHERVLRVLCESVHALRKLSDDIDGAELDYALFAVEDGRAALARLRSHEFNGTALAAFEHCLAVDKNRCAKEYYRQLLQLLRGDTGQGV